MTEARVTALVEDHIGWLTFSNPARLNALTFEMWQQISEHFASFAANNAVRVVVLRGLVRRPQDWTLHLPGQLRAAAGKCAV